MDIAWIFSSSREWDSKGVSMTMTVMKVRRIDNNSYRFLGSTVVGRGSAYSSLESIDCSIRIYIILMSKVYMTSPWVSANFIIKNFKNQHQFFFFSEKYMTLSKENAQSSKIENTFHE